MPKQRRVNSYSTNCSRSSPYLCCSNDPKHVEFDRELGSPEDVKQWREARCPICLDHPHNAVLLLCSSFENGCRPYVCNTGVRHSNCFEQFCKSPASSFMGTRLPEIRSATRRARGGRILQRLNRAHESELLPELHCPLCRGEIHGWSVVAAARKFMNSKSRNCSCETCDFVGNFAELRRHARSEHPFVWPSEADPERQQNWAQMEHQRSIADLISMIYDHSQNNFEDEEDFEDLSIDGIEEEVFPSTNEEEEEEERDERVYYLYAAYVYSYVMGLSAPTNTFTINMNTANGEDTFRQNNSSRRNISPAMLGRRDSPRYATLNRIQNNGARSFTEMVRWIRESGHAAVVRLLGNNTRQTRLQ